ncbi:hypothetical protein KC19_10G178600 [Ceratodon purpureus]|uniref:Macro domain-containing protein n=1 Tax=Ceratodon purpureus TaxID=3225 RepID=A0A8T0GTX2_CERPU|nr:hypothetical protein KC19_10G178600 [Ceratodon purpureus]
MDRKNELPDCKWGAACYRTNPEHLLEFRHPGPGTETNSVKSHEGTTTSQLPALPTSSIERLSDGKDLVLLMLVGPPGAGKSTVCQKIIQNAARPWTRVCQDVISNGKRGSKAQCLKVAGTALSTGRSVLIDRCNIDGTQRQEFLVLAKERGVQAHALVINLPVSVCIQRASKRTEHEGGLEGSGVGGVVTRVSRSRIPPTLEEGFVRITYCRTDTELDKTVSLYSQLDIGGHLPLGVFGASVQEEKGTLRSLLQNGSKELKLKSTSNRQAMQTKVDETDGARSLAFPSISTADFQFDHEMAADIIVETVVEFHRNPSHAGLRFVFVDLSGNSDMLRRVSKKAAEAGMSALQLLIHAGDITNLRTSGGPQCNYIANATNWRLKPGGGGVNAAIFEAAGSEFEAATKEVAKTLQPGDAVAVPIPATSPLRRVEGVTHVIHVLGPNMNPMRPNSLAGDYNQGCQVLRNAYSNLFKVFSSIALKNTNFSNALHKPLEVKDQPETKASLKVAPKNAFTFMMQSAKRKGSGDLDLQQKRERLVSEDSKKNDEGVNKESTKTNSDVDMVDSSTAPLQQSREGKALESAEVTLKKSNEDRATGKWGSWAQELRNIALHPEKHFPAALEITKEAVVIPDKYAKAKKHLLIIARRDGLDSIEDVGSQHLPILKHMHSLGETWARRYIDEDPTLVFRLGYHSEPSMRQLHMHVISQDFDSPNLKNKKHWNSFTSGFFRDSLDVLAEVEEKGQVMPCGSEVEGKFMKMELRCHQCRSAQPNMPRLKAHLLNCRIPLERPYLITSTRAS